MVKRSVILSFALLLALSAKPVVAEDEATYSGDLFSRSTLTGDWGRHSQRRFGASAGDPVPVQYFYSIGIGAKGPIESRPFDQCGIGYYYSSINNPTLQTPFTTLKFLRDEWGFEAYYDIALTRWLLVTPDVQVIGPAQKRQIGTGLGLLRSGEPARRDRTSCRSPLAGFHAPHR